MLRELLSLPLAWLMICLAGFAYFSIVLVWLEHFSSAKTQAKRGRFYRQSMLLPSVVIGALPLIGLLGTVMGLQRSFASLVYVSSQSYAVSAGISFAMLTTLLGLSLAVPGWVLLGYVKSSLHRVKERPVHGH